MKSMIAAAIEIKSIPKSKSGFNNRYQYATLDSLIDMLRGVLPKHGLWFVQYPCSDDGFEIYTRVIHTSGEWFETSVDMKIPDIAGASDAQKLGGAITYFRRYTLSCIFGASCDEDTDGADITVEQKQPKKESKPKPSAHDYLVDIIAKRIESGEPIESIMDHFSEIAGKTIKTFDSMTDDDKKRIANAIYKAKQGKQ